jgi:hypothetical protein
MAMLRSEKEALNALVFWSPIGSILHLTQTTVATTLSPPAGANKLMIQANAATAGTVGMRYILGGTVMPTTLATTAAIGFYLAGNNGSVLEIQVCEKSNIVVIGDAVTNGHFTYQWLGLPGD